MSVTVHTMINISFKSLNDLCNFPQAQAICNRFVDQFLTAIFRRTSRD